MNHCPVIAMYTSCLRYLWRAESVHFQHQAELRRALQYFPILLSSSVKRPCRALMRHQCCKQLLCSLISIRVTTQSSVSAAKLLAEQHTARLIALIMVDSDLGDTGCAPLRGPWKPNTIACSAQASSLTHSAARQTSGGLSVLLAAKSIAAIAAVATASVQLAQLRTDSLSSEHFCN